MFLRGGNGGTKGSSGCARSSSSSTAGLRLELGLSGSRAHALGPSAPGWGFSEAVKVRVWVDAGHSGRGHE